EGEHGTLGTEDARQLLRERLRRRLVEIIEDVPAQDAVDARVGLRESLLEEGGQIGDVPIAHVPIDVLRQVLDEDLAAKLLAEEVDVGPDDRTQIDQDRLFARVQAGKKLPERLRRINRRVGRAA